ncbi:MAG: hypothetical protein U1E65_10980 [Myxococcota bacterium]
MRATGSILLGASLTLVGCSGHTSLHSVPDEVAWVAVSIAGSGFSPLLALGDADLSIYAPNRTPLLAGYSDAQIQPLLAFAPDGSPTDEPLHPPTACEPQLPEPRYTAGLDAGLGLTASWIAGAPSVSRVWIDVSCEREGPLSCALDADARTPRIHGSERSCGLGDFSASARGADNLCVLLRPGPKWRCLPAQPSRASPAGVLSDLGDFTCLREGNSSPCGLRFVPETPGRALRFERRYYALDPPIPLPSPIPQGRRLFGPGSADDFVVFPDRALVLLREGAATSTEAPSCSGAQSRLAIVRGGAEPQIIQGPPCLSRLDRTDDTQFFGIFRDRGWQLGVFEPSGELRTNVRIAAPPESPELSLEAPGTRVLDLVTTADGHWILWSRPGLPNVIAQVSAGLQVLNIRLAPGGPTTVALLEPTQNFAVVLESEPPTVWTFSPTSTAAAVPEPLRAAAAILGGAVNPDDRSGYILTAGPSALRRLTSSFDDFGRIPVDVKTTLTAAAPLGTFFVAAGVDADGRVTLSLNLRGFLARSTTTDSFGVITRAHPDSAGTVWLLNPLEHSLLGVPPPDLPQDQAH